MPKPLAMLRFEAALFSALSYPVTNKLIRDTASYSSQLFILMQCFGMTESAAHKQRPAFSRLLKDSFLQEVLAHFDERHDLAALLATPIRITILEYLCQRHFEEDELIEEIQNEEQMRIKREVDLLVHSILISRWIEGGMVWYGIAEDRVRTVLSLLRRSLENNLLDTLALANDIGCRCPRGESVPLTSLPQAQADLSLREYRNEPPHR